MRPSASASRGSGNGYRVLKKGAGMPVILAHDAQEMVLRQKKGARLLYLRESCHTTDGRPLEIEATTTIPPHTILRSRGLLFEPVEATLFSRATLAGGTPK